MQEAQANRCASVARRAAKLPEEVRDSSRAVCICWLEKRITPQQPASFVGNPPDPLWFGPAWPLDSALVAVRMLTLSARLWC